MIVKILKSLFKFTVFVAVFTSLLYSIISYNTKAIGKCKEEDYIDTNLKMKPSGVKIMSSENSATKDAFKWGVVKEGYISSISNNLIERTALKRNDGFTISIVGGAHRGLDDIFLVKGEFGEFRFLASRMEQREPIGSEYHIISDAAPYVVSKTYIVWVNWSVEHSTAERDKKLRTKYSKDIESALLHFPVEGLPLYNNIPVKDVLFNIGTATKPHYVHAKDIVTGGL